MQHRREERQGKRFRNKQLSVCPQCGLFGRSSDDDDDHCVIGPTKSPFFISHLSSLTFHVSCLILHFSSSIFQHSLTNKDCKTQDRKDKTNNMHHKHLSFALEFAQRTKMNQIAKTLKLISRRSNSIQSNWNLTEPIQSDLRPFFHSLAYANFVPVKATCFRQQTNNNAS